MTLKPHGFHDTNFYMISSFFKISHIRNDTTVPRVLWCILFVLCCIIFFIKATSFAKSTEQNSNTPWNITADELTFFHDTQVVIARGNVQVQRQTMKITADHMLFNNLTQKAMAKGAVVIEMDGDILRGEEGEFDLKNSTGNIKDGNLFLHRNNVHLTADNIWKIGTEEYMADSAIISTCPLPKQDWSFHCTNLHISEEGQAVSKNATFNVRNIPIFYSPWFAAPLNKYRTSGFLLPYFSSSNRNGFEINIPYYWAINDSMDATFYQDILSRRGWMEGIEFRYVLTPESKGIVRYNTLVDRLTDNDFNHDGVTRTTEKRYWLRGKFDQELMQDLQLKVDVDYASDRDYLLEFNNGPMGFDASNRSFKEVFGRSLVERTDLIRPTTVQATRLFEDQFLGAAIQYNQNLVAANKPYTVQTLPLVLSQGYITPLNALLREIIKSSTQEQAYLPDLYYNWNVSYVNYWRNRGDRYQRVDIEPGLLTHLAYNPYIQFMIGGFVDNTLYNTTATQDEFKRAHDVNRTLGRLELEASSTLARNFVSDGGELWRHTIRPKLAYTYRPNKDQDNIPFIDENDRLEPLNRFTWSVLSFLSKKTPVTAERANYSDPLRLYLEQSYDENGIYPGHPALQAKDIFELITPTQKYGQKHDFSDLYTEVEWKPLNFWSIRYDNTYNFYGYGFTTHEIWSNLFTNSGDKAAFGYRYNEMEDINTIELNLDLGLTDKWRGIYETSWNMENHKEVQTTYGLRYQASCWAITTKFRRDNDEYVFGFNLELLGISGFKGF